LAISAANRCHANGAWVINFYPNVLFQEKVVGTEDRLDYLDCL